MADDLTDRSAQIALRAAESEDRDLLSAVYASTREDELALTAWSDAEKAWFVSMQFEAQDAAYHAMYPDGRFLIVSTDGESVGRLYFASLPDEIRVIDIALLPAHRGAGIGSRLLLDVIAEGTAAGLPVRLNVERWNRAKGLYERLGFHVVGGDDVYELMERQPSP